MTQQDLHPEIRREAEEFVRTATAEQLAFLLGDNIWDSESDPRLDRLGNVSMIESVQVSGIFLESIWIKTNDPKRVFEVIIQKGGHESFDIDGVYSEIFLNFPFLEKMWKDLKGPEQVKLICHAYDRGGQPDVDPHYDKNSGFALAATMLELMDAKPGTKVFRHKKILEYASQILHTEEDLVLFRGAIEDFGELIAAEAVKW